MQISGVVFNNLFTFCTMSVHDLFQWVILNGPNLLVDSATEQMFYSWVSSDHFTKQMIRGYHKRLVFPLPWTAIEQEEAV